MSSNDTITQLLSTLQANNLSQTTLPSENNSENKSENCSVLPRDTVVQLLQASKGEWGEAFQKLESG